jgi:hypothetical protein
MRNKSSNTFVQLAVLVCLLMTITSCAGTSLTTLQIPYKYNSLAAGNEGVIIPVIAQGKEKIAISRAIIRALQEMEYSIIEPNIPFGQLLPEGQNIITDAVPLKNIDVLSHNRGSLLSPIPIDALYRIKYRLRYGIVDKPFLTHKHFALKIWSILERRGSGGKWHAYPKLYSGRFFANRLRDRIENELK